MVRTLHLEAWAGSWVALDRLGEVLRHALTLEGLIAVLTRDGIEDVEILRAPDPNEPLIFGLG